MDQDAEYRKKRLLYRSSHRGCKEMDIILGCFAAENLENMTVDELNEYEKITESDDHDLYNYITGKAPCPKHLNCEILNSLRSLSTRASLESTNF